MTAGMLARQAFSLQLLILAMVSAALALAPATGLAASTPIVLDASTSAREPDVAIAADGTAHIAWEVSELGPDVIKYCRLPKGASACDKTASFIPDGAETFSVNILVREPNKVQIVTDRCCRGFAESFYLIESTDGGTAFLPPRVIADNNYVTAIAGPGANAITTAGTGRIEVQVAATDGGTTTGVAELEPSGGQYLPEAALGLLDSATPIVTYSDLTNTFIRRFDSTKSGYNNAANWVPDRQTIPNEDQPSLVSGSAGTYVQTHIEVGGSALNDAWQVRRISESDGSLGSPILSTDIGPPIGATLGVDQGGGVTSVWGTTFDGPLRGATLQPGAGAFPPGGTIVAPSEGNGFSEIQVAQTADHGGVVVYTDNSSFGGSVVGIQAVAIPAGGPVPDAEAPPVPNPVPVPPGPPAATGPPPGPPPVPPPSAACTLTLKPGILAIARGGTCWKETAPGSKLYRHGGTVDLNGIVFTAPSGKSTGVEVNLATGTITSPVGTVKKAGSLVLGSRATNFDFKGPEVFTNLDTAGPGGTAISLLGFSVIGEANVSFGDLAAEITPRLKMPFPFESISAQTTLRATSAGGLELQGAEFRIDNAMVGPLTVKELVVRKGAGVNDFSGEAKVILPGSGTRIDAQIGFVDGELVRFNAKVQGGLPFPFPLAGPVWLTGVGFGYDGTSGFNLAGGAELAFPSGTGPFFFEGIGSPPGTGGGFSLNIPRKGSGVSDSATIKVGGKFQFGELDPDSRLTFGSVGVTYKTPATLSMTANVDLGNRVVGVHGALAGGIDVPTKSFYVAGEVDVCLIVCPGFKGVVSNIGIAACADVYFAELLVGYKYESGFDIGASCNTGPYIPVFFGGTGGAKPDPATPKIKGPGILEFPGYNGDDEPRTASIEIPGSGGVPGVKLDYALGSIAGNTVTTLASDPQDLLRPVSSDDLILVPNKQTNSVRVTVRLQPSILRPIVLKVSQQGGAPINYGGASARSAGTRAASSGGGIRFAKVYPDTQVNARLGGKGRIRTLSFRASNLEGSKRSVQFIETSKGGVAKPLKVTRSARGAVRFRISDGAAGRRSIVAVVRNYAGTPVSTKTVASYTAPGPVRPGTARQLTLRRDRLGRLSITWKGTKGAYRQLVQIQVADGRQLSVSTPKRSYTISQIGKTERVSVTVRGLTKGGLRGKAVTKQTQER